MYSSFRTNQVSVGSKKIVLRNSEKTTLYFLPNKKESFLTVLKLWGLSLICFSVFNSYAQVTAKLGGKIDTRHFGLRYPLTNTPNHAVILQVYKFVNLSPLKAIYDHNNSDEIYADGFNLIRCDFGTGKNSVYDYEIYKFNSFKTYTTDDNYFYALSKNTTEKQLGYYLDVIDLNNFEHVVKNKQFVKYKSRQDHKIIAFKKTDLGLIFVLENDFLVNNQKVVDFFLISDQYKVIRYSQQSLPVSQESFDYVGFYSWEKTCSVLYKEKSVSKSTNHNGEHNRVYALQIDADTNTQDLFTTSASDFIIRSTMFGHSCVVTLNIAAGSKYPEAIEVSELNDEPVRIVLPDFFVTKLKDGDMGTLASEWNYDFSVFSENICLIEAYKAQYTDKGVVLKKYGPGILLKINEEKDLDWFIDLDDLEIKRPSSGKNIACFKSLGSFYMLYGTKGGIVLSEVNTEEGSLINSTIKIKENWLKSKIANWRYTEATNSVLFLLTKGLQLRPMLLSF